VLLRLSACHLSRIPFQWCQTLSLKVSFCYLVDFGSFEMSCICALWFCTKLGPDTNELVVLGDNFRNQVFRFWEACEKVGAVGT
jgi:hypothetical protein